MECRKCNSKNLFLKEKGSQTGLYCSECGAWQKWVPKKDIDIISTIINSNKKELEFIPKEEKEFPEIHTEDKRNFIEKLEDYIITYEKSETRTAEEENTLERFLSWIKYKEF